MDAVANSTVSDDPNFNRSHSIDRETVREGSTVEKQLVISGEDVVFMEFGSGIHYNTPVGTSPRPKPTITPSFDYTIGSYGSGLGANDEWMYRDGGYWISQHGVGASMPIYNAWVEMKDREAGIVRDWLWQRMSGM